MTAWHVGLASLAALAWAGWPAALAHAGDWPQILGPERNGIARDERIVDTFPAAGPRLAWQRDVGHGFAGVAVAGGQGVLFHRLEDEEVLEAFAPQTGQRLWKVAYPTHYRSPHVDDDGPRCVPLIHEQRVYAYGAGGDLHCVDLAKGTTLWSRALLKDFQAPEGFFGAGSTPLIVNDRILINVGGRNGAGVVALSLADGHTLWQALDDAAGYSAPVTARWNQGVRVILISRLNVQALDPESGHVAWKFPFGQRGPSANAASPVTWDDRVFVTASYGTGARLLAIEGDRARVLWEGDDILSSQYTTPILHEGYMYGIDDQRDVTETAPARLRCINPERKTALWTESAFGKATLLLADGKLLILKTDGTLVLARPSPTKFERLSQTRLFHTTTRALPALSQGLFFARDERQLKCLNLTRE